MTGPLLPRDADGRTARYRRTLTSIVQRFVRLMGAQPAVNIARRIPRLTVDDDGTVLEFNLEDPLDTVTQLIEQYSTVIGDTAVTLAQQAAQPAPGAIDDLLLREISLLSGPPPSVMRLLLVDDHALFREGLVSLISPQSDLKVVAQASSASEAIRLAREQKPDLILMDISLPDGTGVDAARAILADDPAIKIMFLTVYEDDEQLFAAVRAGAVGYAFKSMRATELLKSIRGIARGEAAISRPIARRILQEFSKTAAAEPAARPAADPAADLTGREMEIVRELAQGASNREIAAKLVISENTVKNHVRNVLAKLHLNSRHEVADYARTRGLASPRPDAGP
jgi:DNA-binding NarL/FixJ family response regulator